VTTSAPTGGSRVRAKVPAPPGGHRPRARPEPEHEVAVGPLSRLDPERPHAVPLLLHHGMQAGPDRAEVEAGRVDLDPDGKVDRVGEAGQQDRRGDPGGVGDRVGVGLGAQPDRLAFQRRPRDVAGRHHQREPEGSLALVPGQRPGHHQPDGDPLARQEVPDPHGEHARALLLGDRRSAALLHRRVVVGPGLPALPEHAFDHPVPDLHAELGHGRPVRQREDVARLQRPVEAVPEGLGQRNPGHEPGEGRVDVDRLERQVAALGRQRSNPGLPGRPQLVVGQQRQIRGHGCSLRASRSPTGRGPGPDCGSRSPPGRWPGPGPRFPVGWPRPRSRSTVSSGRAASRTA
jgi:hypothetical protein